MACDDCMELDFLVDYIRKNCHGVPEGLSPQKAGFA